MNDPHEAVRPLLACARSGSSRSTVRVDAAALDAIADAARWTGSSQNTQPWRFVILTDRALLDEVAAAGMPQTRSLRTAPAAIAIAMPIDPKRAISLAFDEARAAERILTAANLVGCAPASRGSAVRPVPRWGRRSPCRTTARYARSCPSVIRPRLLDVRSPAPGTARLPRQETVFRGGWKAPSD